MPGLSIVFAYLTTWLTVEWDIGGFGDTTAQTDEGDAKKSRREQGYAGGSGVGA